MGAKVEPLRKPEPGRTPHVFGKRAEANKIRLAKPAAPQEGGKEALFEKRVERLEGLLKFEGELRRQQSVRELIYTLANTLNQVIAVDQVCVLRSARQARLRIEAISHLTSVDRNAPTIVDLERLLTENAASQFGLSKSAMVSETQPKTLDGTGDHDQSPGRVPESFHHGLMVPLVTKDGRAFAFLTVFGSKVGTKGDRLLLERIAAVAQHAWLALEPKPVRRLSSGLRRFLTAVTLCMVFAGLFVPVPLSTLAPVEVVAQSPRIVASPIEGVIAEILVEPNQPVRRGDVLFTYVDTELASRRAIAEQNRNVALARLQTSRQNAFGSGEGRRDVAVLQAELDLAQTELDYAQQRFMQAKVRAPKDGIAVFSRKSDWQGKPVSVGERVIEIADPTRVEYRIDLAVADAIVLKKGARVKVFLDANPLAPREAVLETAGYKAEMSAGDQLAYKVFAQRQNTSGSEKAKARPRIGARGTAQVFGERVSLGFYLFRRPLSAIRQYLGL